MRILITGVGGVTPRSFAQALRKYSKYARYELTGTDSNQYALGLYMPQLFNKSYLVPKVSDPDYWPVIDKIIDAERIDYAIINPELEVVEWAKRSLNHKFQLKVLLPDYRLASLLVDKALLNETLEPYGIVPKSFTITKEDVIDKEDLKLPYPFWIRSALGSSGLGSMKINSFDELKNWIKVNPKVEKFLASEFLPGRNLGCKMLYHNGELLRSAIAERVYYIMSKVAPSGITGNTCFGRLVNDQNVFNVAKQAMDIMFEKTNAPKHGFFTVDLKEGADGKAMVTEVNIRFVAFTQCYAAGGANLPEDLIRVLDNDPSFDRKFKLYVFDPDLIFLRDVDEQPIIMKESQLLSKYPEVKRDDI
jgi:carbamoyl-phosphate synthase large subunit